MARHCAWVFRENGSAFHNALFEPYAVAVFKIYSWDNKHNGDEYCGKSNGVKNEYELGFPVYKISEQLQASLRTFFWVKLYCK